MTASQVYESQPLVAYTRLWRVIFLSFNYVIFLSFYFGQITLTQVDVMLFLVHFSVLCISLVFFSCQDMDVFLGESGQLKIFGIISANLKLFQKWRLLSGQMYGGRIILYVFFNNQKKYLFFQI